MDNSELIAELETKKLEIISRIEEFKGYLKNLDAVIESLTLLSSEEVALRAINKEPDKTWTAREIAEKIISAHQTRNLDTRGLGGKKWMRISHDVLISLFRAGDLERVSQGQYRKRGSLNSQDFHFDKADSQTASLPGGGQDKHTRWRQKQKSKGLCEKCCEPATSETLCDFHRKKKHEAYQRRKDGRETVC